MLFVTPKKKKKRYWDPTLFARELNYIIELSLERHFFPYIQEREGAVFFVPFAFFYFFKFFFGYTCPDHDRKHTSAMVKHHYTTWIASQHKSNDERSCS